MGRFVSGGIWNGFIGRLGSVLAASSHQQIPEHAAALFFENLQRIIVELHVEIVDRNELLEGAAVEIANPDARRRDVDAGDVIDRRQSKLPAEHVHRIAQAFVYSNEVVTLQRFHRECERPLTVAEIARYPAREMLGAEIDDAGLLARRTRLEEITNIIALRPFAKPVGYSAVAGMMAPIEIFRDGPIDGMAQERQSHPAEPAAFGWHEREKMAGDQPSRRKALDSPDLGPAFHMWCYIFGAENPLEHGPKGGAARLWEMIEKKFSFVQCHDRLKPPHACIRRDFGCWTLEVAQDRNALLRKSAARPASCRAIPYS